MAHDFMIPIDDPDSAIGAGWFVEVGGRRVAELVEPMYESGSQFWYSYVIKPLVDGSDERAQLLTKEFWDAGTAVFRSRKFGVVAPNAFTAECGPSPDTHRISVRGLYLQL
jgi:hypothetical protein